MTSDRPPADRRVSRRAALGAAGVGVAGVAAGVGFYAAGGDDDDPAPGGAAQPVTVERWRKERGSRFLIAHRGSGDVLPEHTMVAYEAAAQWGATCMEISVGTTSDGVLICLHDTTYDRTTNATGAVNAQPSTILRSVGVRSPHLGPAWVTDPLPPIPLFEDVLLRFGGRMVLCVEAKDDAAYPAMIAMVERHGLRDSVIVKAYYQSTSIDPAKKAGYPVFAYFGQAVDVPTISALARRLDRRRDYLVITPGSSGPAGDEIDADVVRAAVATRVPVLVAPVHRRWEVAAYFALGAVGAVCSSFGYLNRTTAVAEADTWRYKTIASGEMTKHPDDPTLGPSWTGTDELTLDRPLPQQFLTLGQFGPIARAAQNYQVNFTARWTALPAAADSSLTLAFGHDDDRYYENRIGLGNGFHALLRRDGRLQLFSHVAGSAQGILLGESATTPPVTGQWMTFRLEVTPAALVWSRTEAGGAGTVTFTSGGQRGGYLHIGRSSPDGALALRQFSVG